MENENNKEKITEKDVYNLTWDYFRMHGQQRLTYLNYFFIFSLGLTTAQIAVLTASAGIQFVGILIGVVQIFLSFIFIKIDNRNAFLTKLSERVLKEFEKNFSFSDDAEYMNKIKIFTLEEQESSRKKMMSHKKTFKAIVYTFFSVGVVGIITSIVLTILGALS